MDGTSLLPDIEKGGADGGRLAYSENLQEWETEENALRQSLRTDDFHFIRNLHDGTEEWYDIKKDPEERENLVIQTYLEGPSFSIEVMGADGAEAGMGEGQRRARALSQRVGVGTAEPVSTAVAVGER